MRIADCLTYADIDYLRRINDYYQLECNDHSKNELICTLLRTLGSQKHMREVFHHLTTAEKMFLHLLVFDTSPSYSIEELQAKAKAALRGEESSPRTFILSAMKKGWIFPGHARDTKLFYHVPTDIRKIHIQLFLEPYLKQEASFITELSYYRDEENQLVGDLYRFLDGLQKDIVCLTNEGGIYRQQLKQIMKSFIISEDLAIPKGPRFGFGRRYHLYPDRFSLLYDYGFYQGYFFEEEQGVLQISEKGKSQLWVDPRSEAKRMYRFWIRLYRRPVPHLPVILKYVGLLAHTNWIHTQHLFQAIQPWLEAYYYETVESLFHKLIQMLLHLGVVRVGNQDDNSYITLTDSGRDWLHQIIAFQEKAIEEDFIYVNQ